jgi:UPF0755 protein
MSSKRNLLPAFFLMLFAAGLCVTLLLALNYVIGLGETAKELYGPASPNLSSIQYYRLSYQLLRDQDLLLSPANPGGDEILFTVDLGETPGSTLARLESAGLIASQDALRNYLIYTGHDTRLQAGQFALDPAMTPVEMITVMLDSTPQIITFNILPGWRLEEVAAALPTSGLGISPEEFINAARTRPLSPSFISDLPLGVSLEGYLMPGSYSVDRAIGAGDLLLIMLQSFDEQVTLEIRQGIEQQGLSLHQGITLASIIEKEAVVTEEQPLIASVFFNRLANGINLETDPTVQYALGYNETQDTWWTNPLTLDHLKIDSPYNTYLYPGLPPGPIANPSLGAIRAVAFPAQTPYFYFRAACDGSGLHNFSQTFEEHAGYACP